MHQDQDITWEFGLVTHLSESYWLNDYKTVKISLEYRSLINNAWRQCFSWLRLDLHCMWLWVLQIKMSAEEKEELQEKSSPPQDQIVAVIGNADPKKAKLESKSSPRRGWSMAARKDRNCLPCLHSWSRPHLCLRLCFCKSWLLVRFFYWHVTWNLASQDHFLLYINEPWGFQGLIDLRCADGLVDPTTANASIKVLIILSSRKLKS